MTKREILRRQHKEQALYSLGFKLDEAEQLRRISMTLHRWHELECGIDHGCVERDEQTGQTFWLSSLTGRRSPIADRETGALRRLSKIVTARNARSAYPEGSDQPTQALAYYIQTDPRGCALYIIRPGDVPEGQHVESYYTRGIAIY
jgi:hypothetical protein